MSFHDIDISQHEFITFDGHDLYICGVSHFSCVFLYLKADMVRADVSADVSWY